MVYPVVNQHVQVPQRFHYDNPEGAYQSGEEQEEGLVVPPTNARSQPLAVMVKPVHTIPTEVAVEGALRSDYLACMTKLHPREMCGAGGHYEGGPRA